MSIYPVFSPPPHPPGHQQLQVSRAQNQQQLVVPPKPWQGGRGGGYLASQKYVCPVCGKAHVEGDQLRGHMVSVHGDASLAVYCSLCGKRFTRNYCLRRHMKQKHNSSVWDSSGSVTSVVS